MFNIGFLWLALSIGSEITGTSMIKKTNNFKKLGPSVLVIGADHRRRHHHEYLLADVRKLCPVSAAATLRFFVCAL